MSLASAETSCPVGRPTMRGSNETVEGPQACGMPKVGRPWLAGPKAVDRPLKLASVATVERLNPVRRVRLWKAVERPLKLASVETVERLRSSRPLALLALELELARREKVLLMPLLMSLRLLLGTGALACPPLTESSSRSNMRRRTPAGCRRTTV
jgi:hypothetical protein